MNERFHGTFTFVTRFVLLKSFNKLYKLISRCAVFLNFEMYMNSINAEGNQKTIFIQFVYSNKEK